MFNPFALFMLRTMRFYIFYVVKESRQLHDDRNIDTV